LPTERGTSIATHAVFASRDFPAGSGWVDTQIGIADHHLDPCGRRVDDLVLTGYALTRFMHEASATGPITSIVISNADVFASEAMLDRYVARTLGRVALACLRARMERRSTGRLHFLSFRAIKLPRLAPTQRAFRITFHPANTQELWEEDAVFLARGRTLAVVALASTSSAYDRSAMFRYVRLISTRIAS
jgi:hypothetical protein